MRAVIQRSKKSKVTIDEKVTGEINEGLVILVGFTHQDTDADIDYIVNKLINLRIFDDEDGIMNKSLIDINGSVLSISQFTLYADTKKGRRPSYVDAMSPDKASSLYNKFNNKLREQSIKVEEGIFGADMKVEITNDGPVTIILESKNE